MKRLFLFVGLVGVTALLALVLDMVFEYFYLGWHRVEVRRHDG